MARSLVYRSRFLYELAMLALYGGNYFARYRAIADLIPEGAEVLDVCCGPAVLYERYLRRKGVKYTGLDINEGFIARLVARGGRGIVRDLRSDEPLPAADYVIMQASLYHFLPDNVGPILRQMLAAAHRQLIVAEPVLNITTGGSTLLSRMAKSMADPGTGDPVERFDEATLDAAFAPFAAQMERTFLITGGREKVYVLDTDLGGGNMGGGLVCS